VLIMLTISIIKKSIKRKITMTIRHPQSTLSRQLLAGAALLLLPTPSLLAQSSTEPVAEASPDASQTEQTYSFDIPSQSLAQAIADFSAITGLQVLYTEMVAFEVTAPALQGSFTAEQALNQLVAGSGLHYRYTNANTITLEPMAVQDDGTIELEAITVTGTRQEGYRVSDTGALGVPLAVSETPASVTVISDDLLKDIAARDTDNFLTYVPGVSSADKSGGIRRIFNIRGFPQGSYFVDGLRLSVESVSTQPIETIERIEVLKGPSGVEAALASPGGYINFVTKKPQETYSATVFGGVGDANFWRVGGDITGPLLGDGAISGRLIAIYEQQQWSRPGQDDRPLLTINPSLRWRPTDDTTFDVQLLYIDQDTPLDRGVIYLEGAGFDDDFAPGDWSYHQNDDSQPIETLRWDVQFEHFFNDVFSTRVFYRKFDEDVTRSGFRNADSETSDGVLYTNDVDSLTWSGERLFSAFNFFTDTVESDDYAVGGEITASFDIKTSTNTFKVGYYREDTLAFFSSDASSTRYLSRTIEVDVLDPSNDIDEFGETVETFANFEVASTIDSYYGQWLAEWSPRFRTIASIRYDETEVGERETLKGLTAEAIADIEASFAPGPVELFDGVVTGDLTSYRLAGSYDLTDKFTIFAGYSTSAEPQQGFLPNGGAIDPIEAESFELGTKWQFAGGRALLTGTVYWLERDNISVDDPDNNQLESFVLPLGKVRIRGLELEAVGKITNTLSVFSGLALQDSEILESDDPIVGNRFANVPEFQVSAFVNYNGADFGLPRLDLAVGVVHQGKREANSANQFRLPAYTRVDAAVGYTFENDLEVRLNVENVFDETYYTAAQDSIFGADQISVGDERLFQANVIKRF
jgi:iron complex outermembrane receptor protein